MNTRPVLPLPARLSLAACLIAATWATYAGPPVVSRVEPPNWWTHHSINPVRLLLSGHDLTGARLIAPAGFEIGNLRVNDAGTYLFADLRVPPNARPGPVRVTVATPEGQTSAPFALLAPLPRAGRFAGFSPDDVIYLLMPDRFANGDLANDDPPGSRGLVDRSKPRHYHGGDFAGIRQHLPYLRDLGVTALWPTPWYDNVNRLNFFEKYTPDNRRSDEGAPSTDYHGYGAVDYYGVEEHFGTLRELQRLVDDAHRTGLKVIQDQVANHTGPSHPWTTNSPTPTWYNGTVAQHLDNTWQTWTIAATNPPADKLQATLEGWFINLLPDLNQNDPETATYLIQNSLWWVGITGLDAVRQDTLPYVPRTHWARWTAALKREYPGFPVLGEMWDGNPRLVSFFQGGQPRFDGVDSGIDCLFDFPLFYAIRDVFAQGKPATRLSEVLAADTNYVNPRGLVTFLGLHDTPRFLNEPNATVDGLKLAFTFLATTRGTPMIYYGDEVALRGGGDPDNRRDFPGGWTADSHNAFRKSGRIAEAEAVHAHVRKVFNLRHKLEPLRRGELVELAVTDSTYAFARVSGNRSVIVAFNNSPRPQTIEVPLARAGLSQARTFVDRLSDLGRVTVVSGVARLNLPGRRAAILVP